MSQMQAFWAGVRDTHRILIADLSKPEYSEQPVGVNAVWLTSVENRRLFADMKGGVLSEVQLEKTDGVSRTQYPAAQRVYEMSHRLSTNAEIIEYRKEQQRKKDEVLGIRSAGKNVIALAPAPGK